jgi:hypothetical protein
VAVPLCAKFIAPGRVLDQRLHARCRHLRIDDEHERVLGNVANMDEVLLRIETEIGQGDRHHREAGRRPYQRVAVRSGAGDRSEGDRSAGAGLILHDDHLSEVLGHVSRENANQDVGAAPGRKGHDHRDRARRIGLRIRNVRRRNGGPAEQSDECAPVHIAAAVPRPSDITAPSCWQP